MDCSKLEGFGKYSVSQCLGFSNYFAGLTGTTLP